MEGRRIGERTGCPTRVLHTTVLLAVGVALKHAAAYLYLRGVIVVHYTHTHMRPHIPHTPRAHAHTRARTRPARSGRLREVYTAIIRKSLLDAGAADTKQSDAAAAARWRLGRTAVGLLHRTNGLTALLDDRARAAAATATHVQIVERATAMAVGSTIINLKFENLET